MRTLVYLRNCSRTWWINFKFFPFTEFHCRAIKEIFRPRSLTRSRCRHGNVWVWRWSWRSWWSSPTLCPPTRREESSATRQQWSELHILHATLSRWVSSSFLVKHRVQVENSLEPMLCNILKEQKAGTHDAALEGRKWRRTKNRQHTKGIISFNVSCPSLSFSNSFLFVCLRGTVFHSNCFYQNSCRC